MVRQALVNIALVFISVGCGAAGGSHGGDENLPSAGIHTFVSSEEPVLTVARTDLRKPSLVEAPDGLLWLYVVQVIDDEWRLVRYPHVPPTPISEEEAEEVMAPDMGDWNELQPADVEVQVSEEEFILALIPASGRQVLFASSMDGREWVTSTDWPAISEEDLPPNFVASALSFTAREGETEIFILDGVAQKIIRGHHGESWFFEEVNSIEGDNPEQPGPGLWEADGLSSLFVHATLTAANRRQYRMWYGGIRRAASGLIDGGIGFAGSWEGTQWQRSPAGPTLYAPGFGEKDPIWLQYDGRQYLYFSRFWKKEGDNRHVIGIAYLQDSANSE